MLDLCSGLGGASEAFVQDPKWNVIRIENNPLFHNVPHTIQMDVLDLAKWKLHLATEMIDIVWASPPCRDFSLAFCAPGPTKARAGEDFEPDLSLLEASVSIIEQLRPRYWVIENVVGAIKHFEPKLGKPRQIIGPYVLWGNFPFMAVNAEEIASKKSKDVHSSNPLRSNLRAKVDLVISQTLKEAIEKQKSILEY
jgi:site-specific DNA-cytosine methylase